MAKYDGLARFLGGLPEDQLEADLSFGRIDGLVGGLPSSSRRLRTWWANNSQVQSLAWNRSGWHVQTVDLAGRMVVFARGQVGGTYSGRERTSKKSAADDSAPTMAGLAAPDTQLPHIETADARVVFKWSRLGDASLDPTGKITFPGPIPAGPGLYRFTLTDQSKRSRIYIGESDNLRRRLSTNYRNPGPRQRTSLRINALLVEHLCMGNEVTVDISVSASFVVPGSVPTVVDLSRKAGRLLVESVALVLAQQSNEADIENLG